MRVHLGSHGSLAGQKYSFSGRLYCGPLKLTPDQLRTYSPASKSWYVPVYSVYSGPGPREYGAHSMRRTKATLIYRRTKNLRAVQLLLGHTKLDYVPRRTMSRCCNALRL